MKSFQLSGLDFPGHISAKRAQLLSCFSDRYEELPIKILNLHDHILENEWEEQHPPPETCLAIIIDFGNTSKDFSGGTKSWRIYRKA